jgi:hypothetical protein
LSVLAVAASLIYFKAFDDLAFKGTAGYPGWPGPCCQAPASPYTGFRHCNCNAETTSKLILTILGWLG